MNILPDHDFEDYLAANATTRFWYYETNPEDRYQFQELVKNTFDYQWFTFKKYLYTAFYEIFVRPWKKR